MVGSGPKAVKGDQTLPYSGSGMREVPCSGGSLSHFALSQSN